MMKSLQICSLEISAKHLKDDGITFRESVKLVTSRPFFLQSIHPSNLKGRLEKFDRKTNKTLRKCAGGCLTCSSLEMVCKGDKGNKP